MHYIFVMAVVYNRVAKICVWKLVRRTYISIEYVDCRLQDCP
jgi:hypothetical protein